MPAKSVHYRDQSRGYRKPDRLSPPTSCCCCRCSCWGILAALGVAVLLVASIVIPLVIAIKKFENQTSSQEKKFSYRWNTTGITMLGVTNVVGNGSWQLNTPRGIVFDSSDTLYVADYGNNRVQKLGNGGSPVETATRNSTSGTNSTQLKQPADVAVDSSQNLFIADTMNNRIQYWANAAYYGTTVNGPGNQSNRPSGIAYDSNSARIFVADTNNHRVMSYKLGSNVSTVVAGGNGAGTNRSSLYSPNGLHFDSTSNSLIIANRGANNIVRWTLGQSTWDLIVGSPNGTMGGSSTELHTPADVVLDSVENIYVADTGNHRIQFYFAGQSNGTTIAGITGNQGSNTTLLNLPYSLPLDSQLNLYVADTHNHRIQKFSNIKNN